MSTTKPVVLWSHPRSVSTAFVRSVLTRPDFHILHEPYSHPYYYHPTQHLSDRYPEKTGDKSYEDITREIITQEDSRINFAKDMSAYVVDIGEYPPQIKIPDEDLRKMQHTFLIRDPLKAVPSYYRGCQTNKESFGEWTPDETGLVESKILYEHLVQLDPENPPLVLNSQDLIENPAGVMRTWCNYIGVEYDDSMLTWPAGPVKVFESWEGWHDDVQKTTGFKRDLPASNQSGDEEAQQKQYRSNGTNGDLAAAKNCLPRSVWIEVNRNKEAFDYLKSKAHQFK